MVTRALLVSFLALAGCGEVLSIEDKREIEPPRDVGPRPPPRPETAEVGEPNKLAFAVRSFYFGAFDPDTEQKDPNAWRRFGFDIDGVHTTDARALSDTPGTCRRQPGGPLDVLADGVAGRDNNFGGQLLKFAVEKTGVPLDEPEKGVNTGIQENGRPTFLVAISHLNDGPDDPNVGVALYVTAPSSPPSWWEGKHRLPIDNRTTTAADSITPLMSFERAYMADHIVVTEEVDAPAQTPLLMPFDPQVGMAVLTPLAFTLTFELDEAHTRVLSSTLSMVLTVADQVQMFLPLLSPTLGCDAGPLISPYLEERADLRSDRPGFLDATSTEYCDATSIAMRLDWQPVESPHSNDLRTVTPDGNPCGADGQ